MFHIFSNMILTFLMAIIWPIAGLLVTMLPYAKNNQRLRLWRMILMGVIYINLTIAGLWGALLIISYIQNDWLIIEGNIKGMVPVALTGYLPVVVFTLSRARRLGEANQEQLSAVTLAKTVDPLLVIPLYAAALASGINAFSNVVAQAVMPSLFEIVQRPFLLLLILVVPAFFIVRRYVVVLRRGLILHPFWKRLIKFAAMTAITAIVAVVIIVVHVLWGANLSKLPEATDMMNHHLIDEGGGTPTMMSVHQMRGHSNHSNMVEVAALTGDISDPADVTFELVAQRREITLASGAKIDAWTYNGEIAPELRVRYGDMVEVKLLNKDIDKGVTIHWHGYNVPNAMDGVPGMTQNVVKPGQSFTYKFRAMQDGTYWFHSHQQAAEQVRKGLFGSLIVEPRSGRIDEYDEQFTIINHNWETDQGKKIAFGTEDQMQFKQVEPGKMVNLKIINTQNISQKYLLQGVDYQITSIDGVRIHDPDLLSDDTAFRLASGGRYDIVFRMPDHPVKFKIGDYRESEDPGIVFYGDDDTSSLPKESSFKAESNLFDPTKYGKPIVNELTSATRFDREFTMILGNRMGFYNGQFNFLWTINGEVYPYIPTFVVQEGDRVKTTFVNRSLTEHPMHLHGHHMTVLKKNGKKVRTPWMTDTLNVYAGETYEVAFIADNPGMWMDHCHNLDHAATGMILHLMYDNIIPSYEVGTRSGNLPE
ncbi:multicopper oxidase family protein [Cohnella terricola]|nr:multicopper oxidase family protein [Cohnella terricola]